MKKSLIGTLALGLIIGTGALTVKSFANERTVDTQLFVNKTNPVVSTTDNQSSYQQDAGFKEILILTMDNAVLIWIMGILEIKI